MLYCNHNKYGVTYIMKANDINIRDPFVLFENGRYYMYGTRAGCFGMMAGGFDVYVSDDLVHWSEPVECFDSRKFNLNKGANWAPEVHKYHGKYYMFATFAGENGLKGTYILRSEHPMGPFLPHSNGCVTPKAWDCLDGTLYISQSGTPYVVFCHEHTQIIDGTIDYTQLNEDLTEAITEPVTLFAASSCPWVDKHQKSGHFVTDGPFMHRSQTGELFMIWSSFIKDQYAELLVRFKDGEIGTDLTHLPPIIDDDGGHGMIFKDDNGLKFTFHSPNQMGLEHPVFIEISENDDSISVKQEDLS